MLDICAILLYHERIFIQNTTQYFIFMTAVIYFYSDAGKRYKEYTRIHLIKTKWF